MRKLGECFQVNPDYLFYGKGEMFYIPRGAGEIIQDLRTSDFMHVPMLSDVRAAAGAGAFVENEKAERALAFRKDWLGKQNIAINMLSAIHCVGDSMEPTLKAGDILLVDRSQTELRTDYIYVVFADGLVVKRSGGLSGTMLTLVSDNQTISDRVVDLSLDGNRVIGRVVWFGRAI